MKFQVGDLITFSNPAHDKLLHKAPYSVGVIVAIRASNFGIDDFGIDNKRIQIKWGTDYLENTSESSLNLWIRQKWLTHYPVADRIV